MTHRISKYIFAGIIPFMFCALQLSAQRDTTLSQEVEVSKAYSPSISDAYKINDIPKIEEQEHQKPTFDYQIISQPVFSTFSVTDLQAAKITGQPKTDNGYGMIQVGAGNYGKPYINFFFNNNQSKTSLFGMQFKHLSSHGKVKLVGGDKIKAPFSDNFAELFYKRFYRNTTLSINANFKRDGFSYYGYPVDSIPDLLLEDNQSINLWGTKQAFTKGTLSMSLKNTSRSRSKGKFGMDFKYHYFGTKTKQTEHFADISANYTMPVNDIEASLTLGSSFSRVDGIFNRTTLLNGVRQQIWITTKPSVKIGSKLANIRLGANAYFVIDQDESTDVKITPNILANLTPIEGILNFFAGIDGKYEHNHYSKIAYSNQFVNPDHDVKNSLHQFRFFGGFNGKLSSKTNYKIMADYSMIKDQHFYYLQKWLIPIVDELPDPQITENDFKVLYDDLNLLRFNAQVYHTASDKLNLLVEGNYFVYDLSTQTEAWNLPQFDTKIALNYSVNKQLNLGIEVYAIGQRKGLAVEGNTYKPATPVDIEDIADPTMKIYTLDTTFDLNANATYKITSNFSVFAQLNNFGFQNYERWLGYSVQSFNFLGGANFSF